MTKIAYKVARVVERDGVEVFVSAFSDGYSQVIYEIGEESRPPPLLESANNGLALFSTVERAIEYSSTVPFPVVLECDCDEEVFAPVYIWPASLSDLVKLRRQVDDIKEFGGARKWNCWPDGSVFFMSVTPRKIVSRKYAQRAR